MSDEEVDLVAGSGVVRSSRREVKNLTDASSVEVSQKSILKSVAAITGKRSTKSKN